MAYGSSYKSGSGLGAEQSTPPERPPAGSGSPLRGTTARSLPDKTIEENRSTSLNSENAPVQFPSDLGTDYYISFNSFTHAEERPQEAKRSFTFNKSINLPLPANLSDSFSASYKGEDLYFLGDAAKQGFAAISGGEGGIVGGLSNINMNSVGTGAANALQYLAENKGKLAASVGAMALTGMGGPIASAAKSAFQLTANPFPVMIFQGTNFKPPFTFDWTLYPESYEEAMIIKTIIGFFRREMLPEAMPDNRAILRTPSVFEIKVTPKDALRRFKRCVLTNMNVNYAPTGVSFAGKQLFQGADPSVVPTATSLSLTFQEIEIWLANDYSPMNPFDPNEI